MRRHVAILLCAGYGTRLAAVAAGRPKPLLPVAGRPVLDYLADQLAALPGLDAVHLVTNSRFAADFAAWARGAPVAVTVHDDGTREPAERLGAVGDLAFVVERLGGGEVVVAGALVAAGDNVLRFPLLPLWERLRAGDGCHVLALRETDPERLRRTGVLVLDGAADDDRDDATVRELHEKPAAPPSEWTAPPFYALDAAALAAARPYLAAGGGGDEIGRFVAHLVATRRVRAVRVAGERLDVGSPESWRRADATLRREGLFPHAARRRAM